MEYSFDPASAGARCLARTWLPQLERWELRVPDHHQFIEGNGQVTEAGGRIEVASSQAQQLVDRGYELISVRRSGPAG